MMHLFKTDTTNLMIRDSADKLNHIPCSIRYFWDYDDGVSIGDDFDFGDEEENKKYLKRFESGELTNAILKVEASVDGLPFTGTDILGGCHISSEKELLEIATEHDMKNNACKDLIESMKSSYLKLTPIFRGEA